jgi:diguanylate cyclase (GGDEF)-like protein/PAS domain S-box-containing protein
MIETPQILLVEQEQSVIEQISGLINKIGFKKPHVAGSHEEAQKIARSARPDIALVDMALDDLCTGETTARMLSEDFNLPVIYLVSKNDEKYQSGAQPHYGFIFKTVDQRNLKKTIMLALSRHSQLDNFALLISDLPIPAVIVAPDSLEVLVCNPIFSSLFPSILPQNKLSETPDINCMVAAEISRIVRFQQIEKKPVIDQSVLKTAAGDQIFTIHARQVDSTELPVVLLTFVKNETANAEDLFVYSPAMQLQLDASGQMQRANQKWLKKTGYSQEDIHQNRIDTVLTDESGQSWSGETILPLSPSDLEFTQILELKHKNGENVSYQTSFSVMPRDKSILAVFNQVSNSRDYSEEEINLASALRETAGVLTSTLNFDEVLDRILVSVGQVVPNEAANVMMIWSGVAYIVRSIGYAERGLEESIMSLQIPVTQESHYLNMYTNGLPLAVPDIQEYAALQNISELNWARSMASAPLRSKGQVFGFLNLESSQPGFYNQKHADRLQAFADQAAVAIENARLYAEVQQYAITDELTDIYNRRGLFELGRREVERARRYGRSLAVVMIDTDNFKTINDAYSHAVGDHVLRSMADRWKKSVREVDILGRYGGDEFVILLPETDLSSAMQVADRLRVAICGKAIETPVGDIPVSVSLGVAGITEETTTFDTLIEKADQAMFLAKNSGRNQVKN